MTSGRYGPGAPGLSRPVAARLGASGGTATAGERKAAAAGLRGPAAGLVDRRRVVRHHAHARAQKGRFLTDGGVAAGNMFNAIVSADTLRTTLDSVSVLVDECKVHLEEDGLQIGRAHV